MTARPPHRLQRGLVASMLTVGLAAVAHLHAGGSLGLTPGVLALVPLVSAAGVLLAGKQLGFKRLLALFATGQLAFHVVTGIGEPLLGSARASDMHSSAAMTCAHLAAAAVMALLAARADRRLLRVLETVVARLAGVGTSQVWVIRSPSPARPCSAPFVVPVLDASASPTRGPPAGWFVRRN